MLKSPRTIARLFLDSFLMRLGSLAPLQKATITNTLLTPQDHVLLASESLNEIPKGFVLPFLNLVQMPVTSGHHEGALDIVDELVT